MRIRVIASALMPILLSRFAAASEARIVFAGEKKLNNLVSELLEVSSVRKSSKPVSFTRASDGWILISSTASGKGTFKVILNTASRPDDVIVHAAGDPKLSEAVRYVIKGEHQIQVECQGKVRVDKLVVKAIPELIHCGLGFDPAIKSYGLYDWNFLKRDVLPNITTLIVPQNIKLSTSEIDDWHGQGKRFVAEAGINSEGKTADDHFKYWSGFYERAPFLDGIIINEFIVNNPSSRPGMTISPERQKRMEQEQQRHEVYGQALKQLRADDRWDFGACFGDDLEKQALFLTPSLAVAKLGRNEPIALGPGPGKPSGGAGFCHGSCRHLERAYGPGVAGGTGGAAGQHGL